MLGGGVMANEPGGQKVAARPNFAPVLQAPPGADAGGGGPGADRE